MDAAWLYHLLVIAAVACHRGVGALDSFTGTAHPPQSLARARHGLFRRLRPTLLSHENKSTALDRAADILRVPWCHTERARDYRGRAWLCCQHTAVVGKEYRRRRPCLVSRHLVGRLGML